MAAEPRSKLVSGRSSLRAANPPAKLALGSRTVLAKKWMNFSMEASSFPYPVLLSY